MRRPRGTARPEVLAGRPLPDRKSRRRRREPALVGPRPTVVGAFLGKRQRPHRESEHGDGDVRPREPPRLPARGTHLAAVRLGRLATWSEAFHVSALLVGLGIGLVLVGIAVNPNASFS